MGKIKGCPKGTSLGNIYGNFLWEKKQLIFFLTAFYISHKSCVKIFLKWFINNYFKDTLTGPKKKHINIS